jgi:hypothetical protein
MSNNTNVLRNPIALLVLRVWKERGSVLPLRAHIRRTSDVALGFEHSSTETDIEATVGSVRVWLEDLRDAETVAAAPDAPPTEDPADRPDSGGPASTNGADAAH